MEHLREQGVAVPRVLANVDGETAIELGEWTYEVHEAARGADLYGEAPSWTPFKCVEHARTAGDALARMHVAAERFAAPCRKAQPLVASFTIFAAENSAAAMDEYLAARPSLASNTDVRACAGEAMELLAPFHEQLVPLLPELTPMWTHNDLHASNLLWSDATGSARVSSVIDFGLADLTNAVHDIAHAIERNIVEWLVLAANPDEPDSVPVHLDHLEAMLAGYERVRTLTTAERVALVPMTALCHAEFALSESDYFAAVLNSEERARRAYDGWLVGHARWFHSRAGERLLHWIERWAHSHIGAAQ